MSALVFDIDEGGPEADVASARARNDLWCRGWCFGDGGEGRVGWLGENISRSGGYRGVLGGERRDGIDSVGPLLRIQMGWKNGAGK